MKNYLIYTVGLTLFALVCLLLLNALPAISLDGHTLRRVDMLSEIRPVAPDSIEPDTAQLPPKPVVKPAFVDTCRQGVTCIEDYSDSTMRGMTAFYRALTDEVHRRPVRIAYFGDSFIEGDILTSDLRAMLQQRYGGRGVGFVDITSVTYGFRPTVIHSFNNKWESHAANDTIRFDKHRQGINSRYFFPSCNAYMELRGQSKYATHLDTCSSSTIFFYANKPVTLTASVNGKIESEQRFDADKDMQYMEVTGRIGRVRWTVTQTDSSCFYGATMDDSQGVVLDNFALRASSGMTLRNIPEHILADFNRLRPYDLVVLQYGLNVVTPKGHNYDFYKRGMTHSIQYLKSCFPQASFLLIGVGDRDQKNKNGDIETMPGVKNLILYQQNIAAETGIAFWNMFEAMGGDGSMANLVDAKPQMANLDYTHINFRGGRHIAKLLFDALTYGQEQFNRRRAYETE